MKAAILIHGKKRRGKDAVGEMFKKSYFEKYEIIHFADDLKAVCLSMRNTMKILEGDDVPDRLKCTESAFYDKKTDISRALMQDIGTIFKEKFDPDYWADMTVRKALNLSCEGVIVPDTRFRNEILSFEGNQTFKVFKIKIIRPELDEYEAANRTVFETHESEVDLDHYNEWDYVIHNDGTLTDLKHYVEDIGAEILQLVHAK